MTGIMPLALAVAAVVLQSCTGQKISMPGWVGSTPDSFSVFARGNPLKFIGSLAQMPSETQRIYLTIIGQGLKEKLHTGCNIFAGEDSCVHLPQNSTFAQLCPKHDLRVDCAYFSEDLQEINQNPIQEFKTMLEKRGGSQLLEACESCVVNQQHLWCAQTVPKCGSFSSTVELTILPAIAKVLAAQDAGKPHMLSMAEVVPSLQQAMALSLPCREMCEAIQATCGCGRERKFGQLLDKYMHLTGIKKHVPEGFTEAVFGELADRPLCSLFAHSNSTGFVGNCWEMPQTCQDEAKWCNVETDAPALVEELIAGQLAQGIFGWADSPGGGLLLDEQEAITDADEQDVKLLEQKFLVRASTLPTKQPVHTYSTGFGKSMLITCGVVVALLLCGLAFSWLRQQRQPPSLTILRQPQGYIPMSVIEEGDEAATLLSPVEREEPQ